MILFNGGVATLGILAISADYDAFAKSEAKRFADANRI